MKYLKSIFEKFDSETISSNNQKYLQYFNLYKTGKRSDIVAWNEEGSQDYNFKLVSDYIKPNDSILDYGCGIGDFIKWMKDKGWYGEYLGVDINPEFIKNAENTYPDNKFQLIKSVDEIPGRYNTVCAIGVFTWYITKEEFIKTINKLYEMATDQLILTFLHKRYVTSVDWNSKYRYYNSGFFKELFPNWNVEHKIERGYLLIRVIK